MQTIISPIAHGGQHWLNREKMNVRNFNIFSARCSHKARILYTYLAASTAGESKTLLLLDYLENHQNANNQFLKKIIYKHFFQKIALRLLKKNFTLK